MGAGAADSAAAIVALFVPIGFALLGLASQLVANWLDYTTACDWLLTGQRSGDAAQILVAVALRVAAPPTALGSGVQSIRWTGTWAMSR